jgi:hypothetical protein
VDRMFKNPPTSSHQVLHPEAYFAGELPAPLNPPPAPAGTRLVTSGRMGELGTRVALEVCVEHGVIRDIAPRWAGDAYTIVEGPGHVLTLLWTSAWTADGAAQVVNLLSLEQPCWEDSASRAMPGASKFSAKGAVVAVARGAGDLAAAVAQQLATRAAIPRAAPPIGEVPPPPAVEPARVEGDSFVSPRLALRGAIPDGYAQDNAAAAAELAIQRAGAGFASLSLLTEPLKGDALDAWFQATSGQIASAQNAHLSFVGSAQGKLAGASAEERTWALEGTRTRVRIEVAPWCDGRATLALVRVETGPSAHDALEKFGASIEPSGRAPACVDLQ